MPEDFSRKSPLLDDEDVSRGAPDYSDDERQYLSRLQVRLESARNQREAPHVEFDGMSFSEWWESNEKGANTFIEPKKNKEDSSFSSGTIRQKLLAYLAAVNNLNLSPDISAFDQNDLEVARLGDAMEDIIYKSEEIDEDEEKKMLRQYELLKQGTVFVEEVWDEKFIKDKRIKGNVAFDGKLGGITWTQKLKRYFSKPSRNVINSLMVYLGDIRQYIFKLQPYVFTVDIRSYPEVKAQYGNWDRFKYVSRVINPVLNQRTRSLYDNNWRLITDLEPGFCEVIKYQDKWNNEFAIIINGVLMTPVGLPFPWGYNEYNMEQQNLEPIHSKFAYGNSVPHKLKNKVGAYDEMIRMAVLKTQRSYAPPVINLSGRVLSRSIFAPGKVNYGIPDGSVKPLMPDINEGVQSSEMAMIEMFQRSMDADTVNPVFQGQAPSGDPTATQVLEQQRQAKQMLGLTIFACSMLEHKIGWLRLYNILKNWFQPVDEIVDEARNRLIAKYRTVNVPRPINGEGMGVRVVIPRKGQVPADEVYRMEEEAKRTTGKPHRIIFIDPDEVISSRYMWQMVIRPREKNTNEIAKLMFRAELSDAQFFSQDLNLQYLEEKFAQVWQEDATKMFKRSPQAALASAGGGAAPTAPPGPMDAMGKTLSAAVKQ